MSDRFLRLQQLEQAAAQRILVLDGAMGTMVQRRKLDEAGFRAERFADWPRDVKGNIDLLNLTRPDIVADIHEQYLAAGADIVETNTFSSTAISLADYGMESLAHELNVAGARLARSAVDRAMAKTGKLHFVAGAIGPTSRTASISPDVNDPGFRNIDFDRLRQAYRCAAKGLIEGGVDLLLLETIFDTLNAKAALFAIEEIFEETGEILPIMISGTITDRSGRTLSGQTAQAFWHSLRHVRPFSFGLNCALGADLMRPHIADLARIADTRISAYPNAGLPNAFGEYDEQPAATAEQLREWAQSGLVNIVGGCCGTTPEHIRAIAKAVAGVAPRALPVFAPQLKLAGLEAFSLPVS